MQGYPVLGDYRSLVSLISNGAVDAVVITNRLIAVERLNELQDLCTEHQVALARLSLELDHIVAAS
jgi:UDP-N-acetylglucosamine transferase subunit ALG13